MGLWIYPLSKNLNTKLKGVKCNGTINPRIAKNIYSNNSMGRKYIRKSSKLFNLRLLNN